MGIEEVGRSVQRDRGLAGARPALHHEGAAEFGPDDRILLRLDGRDDVGHAAGPLGGERRHQRGLALQLQPVGVEELGVEHLVVDPDDLAPLTGQVPPRERAERGCRGGLVERSRLRHAPVEQERLQVVVAKADPPDVAVGGLAVVTTLLIRCLLAAQREPAECEPLVDVAQLADPLLEDAGERIPLGIALVGARLGQPHRLELALGLAPQLVEPRVETADVLTFAGKLRR